MDIDDFRSILESSGVDVWTLIDAAILVASLDYGTELKQRRDKIVESLYSKGTGTGLRCTDLHNDVIGVGVSERNTDGHGFKACIKKGSRSHEESKGRAGGSPSTPPMSGHGDDDNEEGDDGLDPYAGLFDDEQKKILEIKQHLEDPDQSEDSLIDLLQNLADMDITFQELKETDIGRHVNRLRKHTSNDVRRLVKQLVRRWKEIVDEWVRLNPHREHAPSALMADGGSPQQKIPQNVRNQVPDFAYSPNPNNGSSGSDKNNSEPERKPKPVPRRGTPARHAQQSVSIADSASQSIQRQREQQKEGNFDSGKLASARKRLQENYKEAENAKKQRTIQMMDIHEVPKAKNAFFAKNKGGGSQGRQR